MLIIENLCRQLTDLSDEEIDVICRMSTILQPLANLEDADIFIDCPTMDGDAIVVAEAKPQSVPSSYKKTVVGLLAKAENEPAVIRTFKLGVATKQMKAITQERINVVQSVEPIWHEKRVIGVLIREKKADEKAKGNDHLHLSAHSYEMLSTAITKIANDSTWLTEFIDEALLLVDANGIITFRNRLAHDLYIKLGFVGEILGKPYDLVKLTETTHSTEGNYTITKAKIGERYLLVKHIKIDKPDTGFAVLIHDDTLRVEQEKQLISKSVAIKEMHHRVKNNLQTIAALLRLQSRRAENEQTQQVLADSINRILSIAATHEILAQSGVDEVNIGEVLGNIKSSVVRNFTNSKPDVQILIEGEDFKVTSDIATTMAVVINELLQNSIKYAFPDERQGYVHIKVKREELYTCIEVVDNGCGFEIEKKESNSLGLSIVKSLVSDKLHGKINISSSDKGTSVAINFNNNISDVASMT